MNGQNWDMHEWTVAGAVIESGCLWAGCPSDEPGLLLVENERRGGHRDWTTPGGVIDAGEDYRSGLAREVQEETGLTVVTWSDLLYTVSVGSKRFTFTPNFRDVGGYADITNFDFTADPLP